jgi:hypothetical protein
MTRGPRSFPPSAKQLEAFQQREDAEARRLAEFAEALESWRRDPQHAEAVGRLEAANRRVEEVRRIIIARRRRPVMRPMSLPELKAYLKGLVDEAVKTGRLLWYCKVRADCMTRMGVTHVTFLKGWEVVPDKKDGKQVRGKGRPPKSIWDE